MMTARQRVLRTLGAIGIGWPLAARNQAGAKIPGASYPSAGSTSRLLQRRRALRRCGAQTAHLPVEQPNKIELVVTLPAAHKLGLKLPAQWLARADLVIE